MNELLLREDLIIEEERLMMFKLCENGIFVKNAHPGLKFEYLSVSLVKQTKDVT